MGKAKSFPLGKEVLERGKDGGKEKGGDWLWVQQGEMHLGSGKFLNRESFIFYGSCPEYLQKHWSLYCQLIWEYDYASNPKLPRHCAMCWVKIQK